MKTVFRALRVGVVMLVVLAVPLAAQRSSGREHGRAVGRGEVGIHFGGKATVERGIGPRLRGGDFCRRWVPARTELVTERVWIPGRTERVWVPPVFNVTLDCHGRERRVCVREGYWQVIQHPGRWECVTREVHIPGYWTA